MSEVSLVGKISKLNKPFIFFHTYDASEQSIRQAISENKSMDLDIAIDSGVPYLGHSIDFYKISGEKRPEKNMDFYSALNLVSEANIPVIIDCKDYNAWEIVESIVLKIGPHRCLVHIYAKELKFNYDIYDHDYPSEWHSIDKLFQLKEKFPTVTTTASAKYLPKDLLKSTKHQNLLRRIREVLKDNKVDTVCLNVPDETMSDNILDFFLKDHIIPHVNIDGIDVLNLTSLYVGETNRLQSATDSEVLDKF